MVKSMVQRCGGTAPLEVPGQGPEDGQQTAQMKELEKEKARKESMEARLLLLL